MSDEKLEVRCFCHRKTLLAICGRDNRSKQPFVHVRTVKNRQLTSEIIVTSGVVRVRCRECFRWHTIRIVQNDINVKEERLPESIMVG